MLFDFVSNRLTTDDHTAVEVAIDEYPELKEEIRQLRGALTYCASLSKIEVSEVLLSDITKRISFRKSVNERWRSRAPFVRFGIPVIAICVLAILILKVFIPNWNMNGAPETITLAKLDRKSPVNGSPEDRSANGALAPMAATLAKTPVTTSTTFVSTTSTSTTSSTSSSSTSTSTTLSVLAAVTPTTRPLTTTTRREGYVYRVFVSTKDASEASDKTKEMILGMGGTKAGEVELGWQEPRGRYFHFIIPEKTYDEFIGFIKTLGPVRIQKDRHPRVMPEGQIRFILLVQDKSKAASVSDAPSSATRSREDGDAGAAGEAGEKYNDSAVGDSGEQQKNPDAKTVVPTDGDAQPPSSGDAPASKESESKPEAK